MQAGQIYKHGRWWVVRYRETVLVNGVAQQQRVVKRLVPYDPRASMTDLKKRAQELLAPINAGSAPESVDTVRHYFQHVFLPYCQQVHKPSTYYSYGVVFNIIKNHDDFCAMRLRQVHTEHVHELLKSIASEKQRSRSTLLNVRNFISAGFKYAKNKGLVPVNPVRDVITPQGVPAGETHAYTLSEVQAMLAVLDEPARTLVLVAALTGLRMGEIQGLKWDDFTGDTLRVGRAIWNGIETAAKTTASAAEIPLLPIVADALAEHKARNGFNEWAFHGDTGNPIRLANLSRRVIEPALEKAKLRWHGWHAFRRGLATNLYALGCPAKMAQAILRHADVATTMEFYIKARPEDTAKEMAKIEVAFKKAKRRPKTAC